MKTRSESSRESSCPFAESVRALWSGELDGANASQVEEHLADCPSCGDLIDALVEPSDELIQSLSSLPPTADDEHEYRALAERLLTTTPDGESASTGFVPLRLANPPLGPLPQTLGNYELLACVGRGAWGAVYRARHTKLEQIVAVKVLDSSRLQSSQAVDRFLQEMKAAGQLHHPNIVRATDAGEDRGFHYLVMEFVDGVDAGRLLQRHGPLEVADACEIVRQAAAALDFAHHQAWVHRDVKPSNLMVDRHGVVKLLDLGVAGKHSGQGPVCESDDYKPARQAPLGTADYMAPEQWTDFTSVDARADVFSLGCTLYRLLTGAVPFDGGAKSVATTSEPNSVIAERVARAGLPRGLGRLVERMLAWEPANRLASAAEVERELTRWARLAELPALVAEVCGGTAQAIAPRTKRVGRFTRRQFLAAAAAAFAAAITLRWATTKPTPRLRRNEWRDLAPVSPMLVAVEPDAQITCDFQKPPRITVSSKELALVHLGRSVSGVFSLEVVLHQQRWEGAAGVFFQGRHLEDHPNVYEFQSLELQPPDQSDDPSVRRLSWSRWQLVDDKGKLSTQCNPWAMADVELGKDPAGQKLLVTLGRRGLPEVTWNGQPIAESRWEFSTEGRRQVSRTPAQVQQQNLGRLGLLNSGGTTKFLYPRLAYR